MRSPLAMWRDWRSRRRDEARSLVTDCLRGKAGLTDEQVWIGTGLDRRQLDAVLAEMERGGAVVWWLRPQEGRQPQRRVYRLADQYQRSGGGV